MASISDKKLLITPHYLPGTSYLAYIYAHPTICLEVCHFYEKQTYQNRCHILTSQGVNKLIVPIQHTGKKQYYKDVKADFSMPWQVKQQRALSTAYGKAPYYHALTDLLFPILERKHPFLLDLSLQMLEAILHFLQLPREITMTQSYVKPIPPDTLDVRELLHPKKKNLEVPLYAPVYHHLFEHPFVPNLSVVDLLFCEGPHAKELFTLQSQV